MKIICPCGCGQRMQIPRARKNKFTIPLIQSMSPSNIASAVIGVQPMSQPSGKIFYKDFIKKQ
jgi:hypothetical protein